MACKPSFSAYVFRKPHNFPAGNLLPLAPSRSVNFLQTHASATVCKRQNSDGSILLETVLAGSIFVLVAVASIGVFLYAQEVSSMAGYRSRAAFLAEEGLEAVRNIKNDDFANLVNGNHGLSAAGGAWEFSGSADATGVFSREVIVRTVDANTKEVEVRVSWQTAGGKISSVAASSRFANWSFRQGGGGGGGGKGRGNN